MGDPEQVLLIWIPVQGWQPTGQTGHFGLRSGKFLAGVSVRFQCYIFGRISLITFAWTLHCSSPSAGTYQAETTIPVLQVAELWEVGGFPQGYRFIGVLLLWWQVALKMERIESHLVLHFLACFFVFTHLVLSGRVAVIISVCLFQIRLRVWKLSYW